MSESPILISNLNDFIFCPASIYFHLLDEDADSMEAQGIAQINGTAAHSKSDHGEYSDRKEVLQALSIYCEKYNLVGKIDTFDCKTGRLTERKKKIKRIYDGYVFQMYAQYFALVEMGFEVTELRLYSMDDNKVYNVDIPKENSEMLINFEKLVDDMNNFCVNDFQQMNLSKCINCIYEPICSCAVHL